LCESNIHIPTAHRYLLTATYNPANPDSDNSLTKDLYAPPTTDQGFC